MAQHRYTTEMIEMNGSKYNLGLLDTCILSDILENKNSEMKTFFDRFINNQPTIIPCVTIWSILELRQKEKVYEKFIEFFSIVPFFILKTPELLLDDEFSFYPYYNKINPILFTFSVLKPESDSLKVFLNRIFTNPVVIKAEKEWKYKRKREILDLILSFKKNFISKNDNYNSSDAKRFIEQALPQYIIKQNPQWTKKRLDNNEEIIFEAFPSVIIVLYNVFYRFYVAKREPQIQDIFDIYINNVVPYVDYVITVKFQADILQKFRKANNHFERITVETIKNLR